MSNPCVADEFASGARRVELILSDVDGTLLDHSQTLTPGVKAAVEAASAAGVPLILATGKALGPWVGPVLEALPLPLPRIHMQGLHIVDPKEGVIFDRTLDEAIFHDTLAFCREHGITLTGYRPNNVYCEETNEHTDRLIFYGEPTPEAIGAWNEELGYSFNKLLVMSDHPSMLRLRPLLEARLTGRAALTSALPGMVEILPPGASKGAGVAWLLQRLGVDPGACMAMGDGENDVEMLRLVGLGVAMGNAVEAARAAADAHTAPNDEDGVARAIEKYVLAPRGLMA